MRFNIVYRTLLLTAGRRGLHAYDLTGLFGVKLGISAAARKEFAVATGIYDPAIVDHIDSVGILDG